VIERARQVLAVLEQRSSGGQSPSGGMRAVLDDLPLFSHQPRPEKPGVNSLYAILDGVQPDELTPRQAIELIYELKKARDAGRRS
jgi:DNA mismatch repair protein MutS